MHDYDLTALRNATNGILNDLYDVPEDLFPHDPINWGELSCIEAARIETDDGRRSYRVIIEEASPTCQELPQYIRTKLTEQGFVSDIEVVTEW